MAQQTSLHDVPLGGTHATLNQLLAEFMVLADALDMPDSERAGILGVSLETWPVWSPATQVPERHAEYRRRLAYALPLMRRTLRNRG
jgi:hypothetical protein